MQSPLIKFKCGHERALPLDERGKALKKKIRQLERELCRQCLRDETEYYADCAAYLMRGRDER